MDTRLFGCVLAGVAMFGAAESSASTIVGWSDRTLNLERQYFLSDFQGYGSQLPLQTEWNLIRPDEEDTRQRLAAMLQSSGIDLDMLHALRDAGLFYLREQGTDQVRLQVDKGYDPEDGSPFIKLSFFVAEQDLDRIVDLDYGLTRHARKAIPNKPIHLVSSVMPA